jgi:hypothetical protein
MQALSDDQNTLFFGGYVFMLINFLSSGWGPISIILAPPVFCFGLYALIYPGGVTRLGRDWLWNGSRETGAALFLIRLVGLIMVLLVLALALFLLVGSFFYHYEY